MDASAIETELHLIAEKLIAKGTELLMKEPFSYNYDIAREIITDVVVFNSIIMCNCREGDPSNDAVNELGHEFANVVSAIEEKLIPNSATSANDIILSFQDKF